MPSPLGHILGGTVVYLAGTSEQCRSRFVLGITLLGSILPDFDFIPGLLIGKMSAYHHGVTHSLAFAVLFGTLVFFILWRVRREIAVRTAILAALSYASHVILDFVSVNEGTRGVPLLWPVSDEQFGYSLGLFGHFYYTDEGIWSVMRWDNVQALLRELLSIGVVVLLFWSRRLLYYTPWPGAQTGSQ